MSETRRAARRSPPAVLRVADSPASLPAPAPGPSPISSQPQADVRGARGEPAVFVVSQAVLLDPAVRLTRARTITRSACGLDAAHRGIGCSRLAPRGAR